MIGISSNPPALPSLATDRGYVAWTMSPVAATAGSALATAGTLYLTRIRRVPAGPITNMVIFLSAAGSSLTTGQCFAALFSSAGAKLGVSADQAAAWASSGFKTMAIAGGPYNHAGGDLYLGLWFNGTTGPSVYRSSDTSATMNNAGLAAPNLETATADTGLTTTAPTSFGAQTGASFHYWAALS